MKFAISETGKKIEATPFAPKIATCHCCGGELTLRSRKTMNNGEKTYYWRHHSNKNRNCSARNRPVS
jgi:hypothetical protein